MTAVLRNEADLRIAPGGSVFRFMQRIGLARAGRASVHQRIVGTILITWVPMCLFALLQGTALGPTPRESFLLDIGTYARFFVGLPVLFVAETIIGPRLTVAGLHFVHDGLVRAPDYPAFELAIASLARRRESVIVTLVTLALAAFGAWNLTAEAAMGVGVNTWQAVRLPPGHAIGVSLAALWNHIVAVPIVLFLMYRWVWRIVIWTLFLWDVSRLDLRLVPTHADSAGGLGFLEIAHTSFGTLAFGLGAVLSGQAAFRILFDGAPLTTFQAPLLILLAVTLLVFLGPMLIFCPLLARTRREGLGAYGALVVRYNRAFHEKWFEGAAPADEPLLGSADIQSLADLGNSFRFISDMRITPFGRWAVIQLAIAAALPGLPLILLVVPIGDIIDALAKVAL